MTGGQPPVRVRRAHVAWVEARLSDRDRSIIQAVARLRLASGMQLEQICFGSLSGQSRAVVRGRVLGRLVRWRALQVVDRRVGGSQRGSSSAIYALDTVGAALNPSQRQRPAAVPGQRFRAHTLAVSQLYADLIHQAAFSLDVSLESFEAEPSCWLADGAGGYLKPDAYLRLQTATEQLDWWVEVDRATESLPSLERQLRRYLAYVERGQIGPGGVVPRVLITVPSEPRRASIERLAHWLPPPAAQLFSVRLHADAARCLIQDLR